MSRVLKIMSIAVVLFLAYMWISVLTKSCNKSNQSELKPKQEAAKDTNEFGSEEFFNEDTITTDSDPSIDYNEIDATIEKAVDNAKGNSEERTAEKPGQKTTPSSDLTTVKEKPVTLKKVPEARNLPDTKTTGPDRPEPLVKTKKLLILRQLLAEILS
ncbi:MAG: hypothetical protein IPN29_12935 [Saprospiraceae bacterium]|nr:hypothetical protein [Saprospiraceae bacterium]